VLFSGKQGAGRPQEGEAAVFEPRISLLEIVLRVLLIYIESDGRITIIPRRKAVSSASSG